MGFLKEFREFAIKGNVVDLAVGVIIGAAFGAIVSAVVEQILMPIIGIITGGINFDALVLRVGDAQLKYGMAITALVKFCFLLSRPSINSSAIRSRLPLRLVLPNSC